MYSRVDVMDSDACPRAYDDPRARNPDDQDVRSLVCTECVRVTVCLLPAISHTRTHTRTHTHMRARPSQWLANTVFTR